MMLNKTEAALVASRLRCAEVAGRQIDAVSLAHPDADVGDAYSIQAESMRLRVQGGDPVRGYKVGLTGSKLQVAYGMCEPIFGYLHASAFGLPQLTEPLLETELAFVLGGRLHADAVTIGDVLAATESVLPAFEIIDSRVHARPMTGVDLVSDNGAAAQAVLSPRSARRSDLDIANLAVELRQNGKMIQSGSSARVLGHPAMAVAWLAVALARQGLELRPGDVVLSGTCTTPVPYSRSSSYEADFGPLGRVRLDGRS